MRFNVVRDSAQDQLRRFRQLGGVDPSRREPLIDAAAQAETRRLTEEFSHSQLLDQSAEDMSVLKGKVHTWRGPSDKESVSREIEKATTFSGHIGKGEMSSHQLATLSGDSEPYHDTTEWTAFSADGIRHVTTTIVGDGGVGCGSIITMAEFLSPVPGQSWRERTSTDFLGQDLIALHGLGTYTPRI